MRAKHASATNYATYIEEKTTDIERCIDSMDTSLMLNEKLSISL